MTPFAKTGSFFYKFMIAVAFCAVLLLPKHLEARVLAGSVTERKINRRIESMLKSARKNYDNGKVEVALNNYWKILEIDPQETFAYLELGEIYVSLRIYDRAIELLEPGLTMAQREMDKDTICYYYCILTTAHLELNQTGLANKTLIKAAEASPKNPMPREILGDIYLANNRIADAIKAYKKAIELDPYYQPAKEKLGAVIAQHGEQRQARPKDRSEIAKKAEKLPPQKATGVRAQPAPAVAAVKAIAPVTPTPRPQAVVAATESENDEDDEEEFVEISSKHVDDSNEKAIPDDLIPLPLPTQPAKTTAAQTAPRPTPIAAPAKVAETPSSTTPATTQAASQTTLSASPEEIETQIDKLLAGTVEEKKAATDFFVKLEEKGLVEIEELLYDPDPEVRIIAIRAITQFKAFTQRVKSMLNDAAEDPDPSVVKELEKAITQLQ